MWQLKIEIAPQRYKTHVVKILEKITLQITVGYKGGFGNKYNWLLREVK